MPTQEFVWTCLPNGLTADRLGLRVSVLLTPHLHAQSDPSVLKSFPEWWDWPATLRTATFTFMADGQRVAIRSVGQLPGTGGPDPASVPSDSAVWSALFPVTVHVVGYEPNFNLLNSQILSHSATDVHDLVRDLYRDLASRTGRSLPRLKVDLLDSPAWKHLIRAVAAVDRWGDDEEGVQIDRPKGTTGTTPLNAAVHMHTVDGTPGRRHVDRALRIKRRFASLPNLQPVGPAGIGAGDVLATAQHLARFELFHTPPLEPKPSVPVPLDDKRIEVETQEFTQPPMPAPADLAATLDFHRIVAAMNAYPVLQRRLGLVVDFVIDRKTLPPKDDINLSVQVAFPAGVLVTGHSDDTDVRPVTHVAHTSTGFFAVTNAGLDPEKDTRIEQGLLDLYTRPERYAVLQADVDGAGLKLMNFARTLGSYQAASAVDPAAVADDVSRKEKEAGAPALRTGGMMLVQKDRHAALRNRFEASKQQIADAALGTTELWAEDLTRGYRVDVWDGKVGSWRSLCRRTAEYHLEGGRRIVLPPGGEDETTVQLAATRSPDRKYNPDILYLHEALVSWTGWSLAAPPPGRAIARDDGAGAGAKPAFSDEAELPPGLDFRSYFRPVRGSLPRLRYGRSYDLRARAVDLAGNSLPPGEKSFGPEDPDHAARPFLRFEPVMPPALALVRPAGGATELPADGESMYRLAILSRNRVFNDATPTDVVARRYAVPPQSTVRDAELHGMLDADGVVDASMFDLLALEKDRDSSDPQSALVEEKIPRRGPLDLAAVDTSFAVWREGASLTYLPDPMARSVRACFIGHPTMTAEETLEILLYPDGNRWPEAQAFRIELYEDATDRPKFDTAGRVLRIPLGKGDRATLRLSMCLSQADVIGRMGLWRWLDEPTRQQIRLDVIEGRHWMFTPWQDVELVHAVQRPLIRPLIKDLHARREGVGITSAIPSFDAVCSLKSTDRLDLRAHWHDAEDDPAQSEPHDRERDDLAFHVKITEARDYTMAVDAFPEHAPPYPDDPDRIEINSRRFERLAKKQHEFNDTRYRRIEYWLEATTRYREYLPADLRLGTDPATGESRPIDTHLILEGPPAVTWIPSSAPPPAPQVASVVPTFAWTRRRDSDGTDRSWRRGGGLRVYLERPWNVSGYGEMLAVVLPPAGFAGDPDEDANGKPYKKYITQWGNDPIWESPFVPGMAPTRGRFPLARWQPDPARKWWPADAPPTEGDQRPGPFDFRPMPPGKDASGPIEIAPHDVFFDSDRRLWYCDIEIDHGRSYWPFVRLALARYQPVSTFGAHLSDIVLADFMQLTADRWLTVRAGGGRTRHVTVYGFGQSNAEGAAADTASDTDAHDALLLPGGAGDASPFSVVEVVVEKLDPSLGEDFGWTRIATGERAGPVAPESAPDGHATQTSRLSPDAVVKARQKVAARDFESLLEGGVAQRLAVAPPLWDGTVTLPAQVAGMRLRLMVAEYEQYQIDDAAGTDRTDGAGAATGRRLVFTEYVELD